MVGRCLELSDVVFIAVVVTNANIPLAADVGIEASEALQELHDEFHEGFDFPKRGANTLSDEFIKCFNACILASKEDSESKVSLLLETLY